MLNTGPVFVGFPDETDLHTAIRAHFGGDDKRCGTCALFTRSAWKPCGWTPPEGLAVPSSFTIRDTNAQEGKLCPTWVKR